MPDVEDEGLLRLQRATVVGEMGCFGLESGNHQEQKVKQNERYLHVEAMGWSSSE